MENNNFNIPERKSTRKDLINAIKNKKIQRNIEGNEIAKKN